MTVVAAEACKQQRSTEGVTRSAHIWIRHDRQSADLPAGTDGSAQPHYADLLSQTAGMMFVSLDILPSTAEPILWSETASGPLANPNTLLWTAGMLLMISIYLLQKSSRSPPDLYASPLTACRLLASTSILLQRSIRVPLAPYMLFQTAGSPFSYLILPLCMQSPHLNEPPQESDCDVRTPCVHPSQPPSLLQPMPSFSSGI